MTHPNDPTPDDLARLGALLDGELDASEAAALEVRLEAEPALREALEDLRRIGDHVRGYEHDAALPDDFGARLRARLEDEGRAATPVRRSSGRLVRILTVGYAAAALVVVGFTVRWALQAPPTTTLDETTYQADRPDPAEPRTEKLGKKDGTWGREVEELGKVERSGLAEAKGRKAARPDASAAGREPRDTRRRSRTEGRPEQPPAGHFGAPGGSVPPNLRPPSDATPDAPPAAPRRERDVAKRKAGSRAAPPPAAAPPSKSAPPTTGGPATGDAPSPASETAPSEAAPSEAPARDQPGSLLRLASRLTKEEVLVLEAPDLASARAQLHVLVRRLELGPPVARSAPVAKAPSGPPRPATPTTPAPPGAAGPIPTPSAGSGGGAAPLPTATPTPAPARLRRLAVADASAVPDLVAVLRDTPTPLEAESRSSVKKIGLGGGAAGDGGVGRREKGRSEDGADAKGRAGSEREEADAESESADDGAADRLLGQLAFELGPEAWRRLQARLAPPAEETQAPAPPSAPAPKEREPSTGDLPKDEAAGELVRVRVLVLVPK